MHDAHLQFAGRTDGPVSVQVELPFRPSGRESAFRLWGQERLQRGVDALRSLRLPSNLVFTLRRHHHRSPAWDELDFDRTDGERPLEQVLQIDSLHAISFLAPLKAAPSGSDAEPLVEPGCWVRRECRRPCHAPYLASRANRK